jgi:hypothetical protein
MQPPNVGGIEFALLLTIWVLFVGVAPYVTWRRGGSRSRIALVLGLSLVPYVGTVAGAAVALTTKRAPARATGKIAEVAGRSRERSGGLRRLGWTVLGVVIVVAIVAAATTGYYLGQQRTPGLMPTWTDREIRATGTQNVGTLRCTYHMADGTVRVQESVIALATDPPVIYIGTPNPLGARTPDCPPSP